MMIPRYALPNLDSPPEVHRQWMFQRFRTIANTIRGAIPLTAEPGSWYLLRLYEMWMWIQVGEEEGTQRIMFPLEMIHFGSYRYFRQFKNTRCSWVRLANGSKWFMVEVPNTIDAMRFHLSQWSYDYAGNEDPRIHPDVGLDLVGMEVIVRSTNIPASQFCHIIPEYNPPPPPAPVSGPALSVSPVDADNYGYPATEDELTDDEDWDLDEEETITHEPACRRVLFPEDEDEEGSNENLPDLVSVSGSDDDFLTM